MNERKAGCPRGTLRRTVAALLSGALFAGGLALGGMTRPEKILGFLDVFGDWDPSLLFVMAGAVTTYALLFRLSLRRSMPLFAERFRLPTRTQIDRPLVVGAVLFGAGWGLAGYCPGPALCSLATGRAEAFLFVGAMLLGMMLPKVAGSWKDRMRAAPND